jgi:long-chain acyl-CoA synthetase
MKDFQIMKISKNIPSLLLEKYKKDPNGKSIGWIENDSIKSIQMKDYFELISEVTLKLEELGLKPEDKVSILANTSHTWNIYDLAALCLNTVVIPIYPTYLAEEVEFILNHSEAVIIVVDTQIQFSKIIQIQDKLPNLKTIISIQAIDVEEKEKLKKDITYYSHEDFILQGKAILEARPKRVEELINSVQDDSIASIVYTSGTTGLPKGAIIRHNSFWSMLDNVRTTLGSNIDESDRSLTFLPLSHVLGRCDSMLGLALGMETIYAESIEKIIDNISLSKPTIMIAVPRIFEKIYSKIIDGVKSEGIVKQKVFSWAEEVSSKYYNFLDNDQSPPAQYIAAKSLAYKTVFSKIYNRFGGNIRFFVSGGAPLSKEIIKFLRNANLTILEGYGLTETIAPCFLNPVSKQIPGTVGLPLGDTQIKFADDGEILLKTDALFSGYYKNESETNSCFDDEWFKTGDIGELNSQGYLAITDRKKDIIITSGGKNVAPQKIENLMKTRSFISHFMVVGDQKKYLTGIVGIEKESFLKILDDLGLKSNCTLEEISKNQGVIDLINNEITVVNEGLAKFETIKDIFISPVELTPESGLVTPSLKLKKKEILKRFTSDINALYNQKTF